MAVVSILFLEILEKFMLSYSYEYSLNSTEYQHIMELPVEYLSIKDIYSADVSISVDTSDYIIFKVTLQFNMTEKRGKEKHSPLHVLEMHLFHC